MATHLPHRVISSHISRKSRRCPDGLFAVVMFRCKNVGAVLPADPPSTSGCVFAETSAAQSDFPAGITPPSATVSSAATSRTVWPSNGRRSSVRRLVMPDTEIAASGSLQSL